MLAAAVVVAGGLAAVARAAFNLASDLRDNKVATLANTRELGELRTLMQTRIASIEERVWRIEGSVYRGARLHGRTTRSGSLRAGCKARGTK